MKMDMDKMIEKIKEHPDVVGVDVHWDKVKIEVKGSKKLYVVPLKHNELLMFATLRGWL